MTFCVWVESKRNSITCICSHTYNFHIFHNLKRYVNVICTCTLKQYKKKWNTNLNVTWIFLNKLWSFPPIKGSLKFICRGCTLIFLTVTVCPLEKILLKRFFKVFSKFFLIKFFHQIINFVEVLVYFLIYNSFTRG